MRIKDYRLYDEMDFLWVCDHYDIHLSGLCRHKGKICHFRIVDIEARVPEYEITHLSLVERALWLIRKRWFEFCVGEHYSYPQCENGAMFTNRRPRMFKLYYWLKRPYSWCSPAR